MLIEHVTQRPNYRFFQNNDFSYAIEIPQTWQDPEKQDNTIIFKDGNQRPLVTLTPVKTINGEILIKSPRFYELPPNGILRSDQTGSWQDSPCREIVVDFQAAAGSFKQILLYINANGYIYQLIGTIPLGVAIEEESLQMMGTFTVLAPKNETSNTTANTDTNADTGVYVVVVYILGTQENEQYRVEVYGQNEEHLGSNGVIGLLISPSITTFPILGHKIPRYSDYKVCVKRLNGWNKNCTTHKRFSLGNDNVTIYAP